MKARAYKYKRSRFKGWVKRLLLWLLHVVLQSGGLKPAAAKIQAVLQGFVLEQQTLYIALCASE